MKPLTLAVALFSLVTVPAGITAETLRFTPQVFYNTFSSAHPPALKIKSGDRVITTTVDDMGTDAAGKTVAKGHSPQTGPFFIEGAEPGDLIVVTLEKLEPSRTSGVAPSVMVPATFDAGSLANHEAAGVPWTIDKAKKVVRLDLTAVIPNVDWRERFSPPVIELPLRPMLGSLGVAPVSPVSPVSKDGKEKDMGESMTPGPFGGNLDYAGLTAGVRVMLPVYQPGALLFLGQGYAREGEGNVSGSGIETSMDVEFSVELVKKKEWPHSSVVRPSTVAGEFPIEWPRIETDDYVMAVGSAPTLLQAFQHATSELDHWLDDDFGFSERTVAIVMGQATEYEIANVADGNYTVAAKVRKSYLPKTAPAPSAPKTAALK